MMPYSTTTTTSSASVWAPLWLPCPFPTISDDRMLFGLVWIFLLGPSFQAFPIFHNLV